MPIPPIPPAGITPLGQAGPFVLVDPAHPPAYLADDIDPLTGDFRSVLSGLDPIDAMVIQAVRVEEGSGASTNGTGNRFRRIQKVNDSVEQSVRFEYQRCLGELVRRKLIRIDRIVVDIDGSDAISSLCLYTNLGTGRQDKVSFQ